MQRSRQGDVTTVAGDGEEGSDDGDATEASFSYPGGIALYYDDSESEGGWCSRKTTFCISERRRADEKERHERTRELQCSRHETENLKQRRSTY